LNIVYFIRTRHQSAPHSYEADVPIIQRSLIVNSNVSNVKIKLLERLDPAMAEMIDNPEKIPQTTAIGTLF
jgi:hypothetical protein